MKGLKKYWTHIVGIGFNIVLLITCILLYYIKLHPEFDNENNLGLAITLLTLVGIFSILIWVIIIYTFIKISKNKKIKNKTKYYIFTYLFNLFYIPCYHLEYESKDKNYKLKNFIYYIFSIVTFGISIIFLYYSL